MFHQTIKAAIFIIIKDNQILFEERKFPHSEKLHLVFPGGVMEKNDQDIEQTFKRELLEELGINPISFIKLSEHTINYSISKILTPFLVTEWVGKIPSKIKDQNNKLIWIDIKTALNSPLAEIRNILNKSDINNLLVFS